jgi:hypothetical protein
LTDLSRNTSHQNNHRIMSKPETRSSKKTPTGSVPEPTPSTSRGPERQDPKHVPAPVDPHKSYSQVVQGQDPSTQQPISHSTQIPVQPQVTPTPYQPWPPQPAYYTPVGTPMYYQQQYQPPYQVIYPPEPPIEHQVYPERKTIIKIQTIDLNEVF